MPVQTVVELLREYLTDEGDSLKQRAGPEAVTVAQDIEALLDNRLRTESAYEPIWTRFLTDPPAGEANLIGALEAQVEADPALAKRLNGFVEEYHRVLASSQTRPNQPQVDKSPVGGGVPDTTFTAEDDSTVGEGTYLYGNIRSSGVATVGPGIEGEEPDLDRPGPTAATEPEEHEVRELFERIYASLRDSEDVDPPIEAKIERAVGEIEDEIGKGVTADVDLLERKLLSIKQLSPHGLEIVLGELGEPAIGVRLLPTQFFQYVRKLQSESRRKDTP